ncbi:MULTISPECIES: hypothetical protein [Corynebacterium]|mgnify:CR=1 FL=1|uniref:Uncharacterized protein n=1 Tax=Corynebacterium lipophilum TaxID=2804918 RepID=A0AAW5HT15_9CORY|nr:MULTISPECIES: hypothetical protein [Corynebacterium]MCO6394639.1 hypothetical protein [Corynebacterium lipophilum]MCZ2117138.1 hypothetical protein [Corynebacterium lipophilum]OIR41772.1 hypothetical protein BJP06_09675 [Corynebacterium sp. NML120713]
MANFKDIMTLCLEGATYSAIAVALDCSRRDIAKTKTLIADHGITKESFTQLDPSFSTSTSATIAGPAASAMTSRISKNWA